MGIIREETKNPDIDAKISVVEREPRECREPWEIIDFEFDGGHRMTPLELQELGRWLTREGVRIAKEYTPKGTKRRRSLGENANYALRTNNPKWTGHRFHLQPKATSQEM